MNHTYYLGNLIATPELAEFAAEVIALSGVNICSGNGYKDPVIEPDRIELNGDNAEGQAGDAFCLGTKPQTGNNRVCATDHHDYDVVVASILFAALKLKTPGYDTLFTNSSLPQFWEEGSIDLYVRAYHYLYDDDPLDKDFRTAFASFLREKTDE